MQDKPYFCPNCRSNRVKFRVMTTYAQPIMKDALTGSVTDMQEAEPLQQAEENVQCMVCQFIGNEMRFIKQAEREPRPGGTLQGRM